MSIKYSILALLEPQPAYGYQLRATFEKVTGSTWPLNIGQVYTTLARLERDELVEALPRNDAGQCPYQITELGRKSLAAWFSSPVKAVDYSRDELAIKIALAVSTPGVEVREVIQKQRVATLRTLQEYTRIKHTSEEADLAWTLVIESMIYRAEAQVRWLDHTENYLNQQNFPKVSPDEVAATRRVIPRRRRRRATV